ncbi:hypothetical protein NUBL21982_19370 [Klebsiella pneumoniae]|nr:hypothetical protein NUBL21982_19370 [Klebsiella pneumoniae]
MSRSTWYYNMNALKQGDRYAGLKENIRKIYHYHKGRYGYRRITLALRKQGLRINHKTVQRLMAELSLRSVIRAKKYRAWKGRTGEAAPNILSRNFAAAALGSGLALQDEELSGTFKGAWDDAEYVA